MEATLPEDLQSSLDIELEALKEARSDRGASADYLQFTERLSKATANARAAIRASGPAGRNQSSQDSEADRLLSLREVGLDRTILKQLVLDIEGEAEEGSQETHLRRLARASEEDPGLLEAVAAAASLGEDARPLKEAADRLGLPVHALLLVGRLLAAPFLMEARLRRGTLPEIDMREGEKSVAEGPVDRRHLRCPSCGSAPGLAVLCRDGGSRRFLCQLCGEGWLAARLMCPTCGTRDQSKLATLCVAETDPRWVETCDECHRYVKTVDENRLPEAFVVIPRAEEARSLYLDVLADQEGYVRSAL